MSINQNRSHKRQVSKYLLNPTPKPSVQQNQLSEISEQEGMRTRNQAQILKEIIIQKNEEIALLKKQLERLKSQTYHSQKGSVNLVLSRPIGTDDSIKQHQRERHMYNSAKMRHKRIFSMGEYDTQPVFPPHSEASIYKQSMYK